MCHAPGLPFFVLFAGEVILYKGSYKAVLKGKKLNMDKGSRHSPTHFPQDALNISMFCILSPWWPWFHKMRRWGLCPSVACACKDPTGGADPGDLAHRDNSSCFTSSSGALSEWLNLSVPGSHPFKMGLSDSSHLIGLLREWRVDVEKAFRIEPSTQWAPCESLFLWLVMVFLFSQRGLNAIAAP